MVFAFLPGPVCLVGRALHLWKRGLQNSACESRRRGLSYSRKDRHTALLCATGDDATTDGDVGYGAWLDAQQRQRNEGKTSSRLTSNIETEIAQDSETPPAFRQPTLFHDGAEEYAMSMTSLASPSTQMIAKRTAEEDMFAPCMVGQIEGQLLKMLCRMQRARRVLDIGTFTGNSAMAFAEGMGGDGEVVTIEFDPAYARVARECFESSPYRDSITLIEGDARKIVREMAEENQKFDIVFLDADKQNYSYYYELGLQMLEDGGSLMADNTLCALLYEDTDDAKQKLHEFNQLVRRDDRVEQVMMTVREGVLLVQKKRD